MVLLDMARNPKSRPFHDPAQELLIITGMGNNSKDGEAVIKVQCWKIDYCCCLPLLLSAGCSCVAVCCRSAAAAAAASVIRASKSMGYGGHLPVPVKRGRDVRQVS